MKVPWSRPCIGEGEKKAVQRVLDSGWVTQGPETERFEQELAGYIGCNHVICVNNGTAALIVTMLSHKVKRVVIPAYAYPSMMNILRVVDAYSVFNDIDPETVQMEPSKWQEKDYFYIPTSFAGLPLEAGSWQGLPLIEDAAEALGAKSLGLRTGGQGHTTIFSFHAAKLITTIEGGAVTTNDDELADRVRHIRKRDYLNFQTTDVASAIGRTQLKKINKYISNRHKIADYYRTSLQGSVNFQRVPDHVDCHPWMMFPIFVDNPKRLAERLGKREIETRLGWEPLYPAKNALWVSKHILCLPIYNSMTLEEAEYVVKWVRKLL